jgi:hypothetical protein
MSELSMKRSRSFEKTGWLAGFPDGWLGRGKMDVTPVGGG